MKKILGLDLGAASIGWALITENGDAKETKILDAGVRIIPYEGTEGRDFSKGAGESKNSVRTKARTARKRYDRYQLRRKYLVNILIKHNMMPDENLMAMPKINLWEIRSKAVKEKITLQELGRILLLLNQKRGYKSSRSDANLDKKDTEYVANVKSRHEMIKELGLTIGQYFFIKLQEDEFFRIKGNVFPREAYTEEFDKIISFQKQFYSELSSDLIDRVRNEIIYYQRPLKSQKGLVSVCEFEGRWVTKGNKEYFVGPKVAPKSSPLFQIEKIWENINNIKISDPSGGTLSLSKEQKQALFQHLDNNERLTEKDLFNILGRRKDECLLNKQLSKGLQGNTTKNVIRKCFENSESESYLRMELKIKEGNNEGYLYDRKTGEILNAKPVRYIDPCFEKEPLYILWHVIYSISDQEECSKIIQRKFGLDETIAGKLATIDFTKSGFGNKSARVIRKILPYLMEGDAYSDAMSYAGYNHSNSLTTQQNLERKILNKIKPLAKNSLRQPVVEKILNQLINVVNSIIIKHGNPDEIRVELARELKQTKEERNETERAMRKRESENESIARSLAEYGLRATRNNIIKWRLYTEMDGEDKKMNAICIYCGQPISFTEAILGNNIDVEHIIPKSKFFDDSQSNKTLAHRHCNRNKNEQTAFDFMKGKSEEEFQNYVERVNHLYSSQVISKSKRDKLLMSESKIPDNFIDRQLRESQYISRKAREILSSVCRNVWCTSGQVTSELRHLWGYDDVLMNLQLPKYKEHGLTEIREWESDFGNNKHSREVIRNWSKRDDQRHHAIDAITIACTRQGFIQRFNTLNSQKTREELANVVKQNSIFHKEKLSLLDKYIISQKPMSVKEVEKAASEILISYKSGKRVSVKGSRKAGTHGKRQIIQKDIVVPRGPLSEESVYGCIKAIDSKKPVKYLFDNPQLIIKPKIKRLVEQRIESHNGDKKKALSSIKTDPLYIDKDNKIKLEYASCFRNEYIIKYPVDSNFNKVDKVVDSYIKNILQTRINKFGGKIKEAFRDVKNENGEIIKWYEDEGLKTPIISVRCYTGLSAVVPAKKDDTGRDIGFVKPGNNHHIAIYTNREGKLIEHVCTFWQAVERKKYGIPAVIKQPELIWDKIFEKEEGTYPESFLIKLPLADWKFQISMQQNEMFILGMSREEFKIALAGNNLAAISQNLYRVQKLTEGDYFFRHHLETQINDSKEALKINKFIRVQSIKALNELEPVKIKIDVLGNIIKLDD